MRVSNVYLCIKLKERSYSHISTFDNDYLSLFLSSGFFFSNFMIYFILDLVAGGSDSSKSKENRIDW